MSQVITLRTGGVVPPGTAVVTITGNTGGAVPPDAAGNIDLVTQNTTVDVAGIPASNLLTINFGIENLILGSDALGITTAVFNAGVGFGSLNSLTSGIQNACVGRVALASLTTGSDNIALGYNAAGYLTTGARNISIGTNANSGTAADTVGNDNIAIGYNASGLRNGTFGNINQYNICIGSGAGANNLGSNASSNILLNRTDSNSASNRLYIGNATGTGNQELSSAFICGIDGVNVGSVAKVVTMASDQLGTATITAGTGITVTPGANSITISATTTGMPWTVVTGASQALAVNNGYIANNAGTINFSLPASSAVGDTIRITGINNATGWQITQGAGQQIFFGTSSTTAGAGGSITSSATRDSIEIVCVVANTTWNVLSCIGNPTIV